MIFDELPVSAAEGCILAHSIDLLGRRLRKGVTLNKAHIDELTRAGITHISAARLQERDIAEDAAAVALAKALVPYPEQAGLRLSAAFTGRVNLIATGAGVVSQNVKKLIALNSIDSMISLATLPQYQQVSTGSLVGTVKIISYGVSGDKLQAACKLAQAAIKVLPPVMRSASLIVSVSKGGPGENGVETIRQRLAALNITLVEVVTTPHQTQEMAHALKDASGDLILMLTSSATSDLNDTAPKAVRAAGGNIERFGMPVDPGNILFLGALTGKPVIGFPGCVRSPALNGADWVLSRIACGVTLDDHSFAEMAIGGLLKEIPTRPQPRRRSEG